MATAKQAKLVKYIHEQMAKAWKTHSNLANLRAMTLYAMDCIENQILDQESHSSFYLEDTKKAFDKEFKKYV